MNNTLLRQIKKNIIFRILSTDFFFYRPYMKAFFMLHKLAPEEQHEYQLYRLQQLLHYAHHTIPYWKRIGNELTKKRTFDIKKFERLPLLTRETLIKHKDTLVIPNIDQYKFRTFVTSGSTGIPKRFFGKKVYFQKMMATEEFYVQFCGVKDFREYGYSTGKPHLEDLVTYLPAKIDDDVLQKLLDTVSSIGGTLYRLLSLAEKVESGEMKFKPKFVLSGSEFLTTSDRKYLEEIFQCPVYNKYVCAEVGILGLECSALGGFHIDPVSCYVEIVNDDGYPVENGVRGKIVITTFNNRLMPLIRYDIGDTGAWIAGECTCGLTTPRLFFEGREMHFIKLSSGEKFSVIALMQIVNIKFENIVVKQQIVQESINKIVLKFVPGPDYRPFHDGEIIKQIERLFFKFKLPELSIEVRMVTSIDNFKNGKRIIFESHIKD